ncbi:MAG: DUF2155 domain-containing protein [Alphaproteobacteria bacterium]|nr:DUF2155 domain-containing protein [Alphaproteobacteria bacterium]
MENKPRIQLRSLDKITARTMTFDARVGSTLKFGSLYMKVQSCQKTTPIEQPESAAFLQIWEIDAKKQSHWVFSGWMFSSSPALSAMDHPIYDVWLIDCLDDEGTPEAAVEDQAGAPAEAAQETQSPAENEKDGIVTDEPPSNPGDMLE